jgi:4,5-DOPA dioxygenase extradiol
MTAQPMPVVFFGHGSPMIALETNDVTRTWRAMALSMPRPKAILCISAHWLTCGSAVTSMQQPTTIHDFGPMSEALFKIRYAAPGSPALAARVRDLLAPTPVALDDGGWGLDHGTWSVLMKAYPEADIPVVQLSMDATKPPAWHYEQGQRLRALRQEGVLIMGTGNTVHNLGTMSRQDRFGTPYDWATRFSDVIRDAVLHDHPQAVIDFGDQGRDARLAQPTPDHFWPLLYALGARLPGDQVEIPVDHIENLSIGMTSFVLRPPAYAAGDRASVSALNG